MPADSHDARGRGRRDRAPALDEDAIERSPADAPARASAADLRAQLAANRTGATRLPSCTSACRSPRRMEATIDYAERRTRAAIEGARGRRAHAEDVLEAPTATCTLQLDATVDGDELHLDFTGSADQHDGNLNCPLAVTVSACWFAVRVLTDPDIPPSSGAMRPVTVTRPRARCSTPTPPPPSSPATSRRRRASPTSS
jgi:N-methylhydantoinase B